MRTLIFVAILASVVSAAAISQDSSEKYQPATITAVTRHKDSAAEDRDDTARYDVSLKVGNTLFVCLYTPPNGGNQVEYTAGLERLVLVKADRLIFQSALNGTIELPILRRETLPPQPAVDLSRAAGEYFTMKMQNLTASLNLSDEQQAQIKPIAEQESAEVSAVCFTPTVPGKERLKQWEKIVQSSDARMKPILSQTQWQELQDLRKDQKQELKKIVAQGN